MGPSPKTTTLSGMSLRAACSPAWRCGLATALVLGAVACGVEPGASPASEEAGAGLTQQEQSAKGMNSLSLNGLSVNGLSVNGLSVNGLSVNGLTTSSFVSWFETAPEQHDEVMRYVIRCAVPQGEVRTYTSPTTGLTYTWQGGLGVAPAWAQGTPATVVEQQVVSACLAAHVNTYGYNVPISITGLKGDGTPLAYSREEDRTFGLREACFFGNLFTNEGLYAANDQRRLADNLSSPRRCGWSHTQSGMDPACPAMVRVGSCSELNCKQSKSSPYYTECTYNGVTYRPLTTRLREEDIYICGDGICQISEHCGSGKSANSCGVDCGPCAKARANANARGR